MSEFYRYIKKLNKQKEDYFVRATVFEVLGSAYRHKGAMMFFGKDGKQYGTLSAGCLEEDLSYHATEVMTTLHSKIVEYDLSSDNDILWGIGSGCNGKIKVLLEPFGWSYVPPNHNQPALPVIERLLDDGKSIFIVKSIGGKVAAGTMIYCSNDEMVTGHMDQGVQQRLVSHLNEFSDLGTEFQYTVVQDLESEFVFERIKPRDTLYIFGAGPDVEPVVKLTSAFDFETIVIDPRSVRCNRNFFPSADVLINEHPEVFLKENRLRENSYVIIMTHNFSRDKQILPLLLDQSPPCYIGILGSRVRTERLLPPKQLLDKIHSPVGLNIGAEGPEEISISIMAQLIQFRKLIC
ncbi:XdhC family protein [Peribacillus sp. NPDC097895]|uniref:XdhC family protein n=1 Tax=Peribacillus sp. NPDC097895 TaxID=3390619 RepID=UPI003CFC6973